MQKSMSNGAGSLSGKVAIVTGAARGIGAASAVALAQAGASVLVNDLLSTDETVSKIQSAGGRAIGALADVTDQSAVEQMVALAVKEFGRLDIAVSNAAYSDRQLFYLANMEGFRRTIDVCMWGPLYLFRAAANQMIEAKEGGSMVCISSPHANIAVPGSTAYNMAKAAVDQLSRTAACELARHRIRVNIIHPGWTDTPGERKFFSDKELVQRGSDLPWGRLAQPEEIARGVVFLCEPASQYINGSTLSIDGGSRLPHQEMFRIYGRD